MPRFHDERDWFFAARFGLFIHWGLYAIPAWHEQHQFRLRVPRADYGALAAQFNPTRFDPEAWLDLAEAAGMRYLTFTTKHQDGFCLWNTAHTDFNVMHTPYGRDILAEVADACHRRGMPLCLYYCLVDNHHPAYPNQGRGHELATPEPGDVPDVARYVAYVRAQAEELCTRYGKIHGFWWDVNDMAHHDLTLNAQIRAWQPGILINNRGFGPGDFATPERDWDSALREPAAFTAPTEACQSIGVESWGYRADEDYYTDRYLQQSIANVLAKGGNYLLNVGPQADGRLPVVGERMLRDLGAWMGHVRECFDGTAFDAACSTPEMLVTRRGHTRYLLLTAPPASDRVLLPSITALPRAATLLNTGAPVAASLDLLPGQHATGTCFLRLKGLPANACAGTVLAVKLEFGEAGL